MLPTASGHCMLEKATSRARCTLILGRIKINFSALELRTTWLPIFSTASDDLYSQKHSLNKPLLATSFLMRKTMFKMFQNGCFRFY